MRRRNKRMKEKRKPFSPVSVGAALTGAGTLILFFVAILLSASRQGAAGRLLGAVSFLCMLIAFLGLFRGWSERKNENFNTAICWCGVILPAVSAGCWMALYLLGAVIG